MQRCIRNRREIAAAYRLLNAASMRHLVCLLVAVLPACELGAVDDPFWDETSEDDGTEIIAAGANQKVGITGGKDDHPELVKLVPVGRSEGKAERKVAMRLSPAELPALAKGDRLIVPAEFQVTTRCDIGQNAPGCGYNPHVRVQLILTGNADDKTGGGNSRVIATKTQTCTRNEHHCMFVFSPGEAAITLGDTPCVASDSCYVNLVVWTWHSNARAGGDDKLLVGGNDGNFLDNGKVDQDKARLMAVRERGIGAADRASRESSGSGTKSINTNANAELIYSHRLKPQGQGIKKGEQFIVEAKIAADTAGRARFSSELIAVKNPDAKDGKIESFVPDAINESNGFNCTGGACTQRKVAVFRAKEDINDAVFINVVVKAAVPGGGSTRITVKKGDGWVKSVRYGAAYAD
jgi:hypothetical protein